MKKYQFYIYPLLAMLLQNSCTEEPIGQYPIDQIPPQQVKNIEIENLEGAVNLTYELPKEDDLLYVQALYDLPSGKQGITKTSVFSNSMLIKGFGKSAKRKVQLVSVDRSRNESQPVTIEVEPLDSPIYGILEELVVRESFGGFKLSWLNTLKEDIVVGVLKKDKSTGGFNYIENFYSSEAVANKAVRGQDSTLSTFGIFVRDVYENYTDTLVKDLKPYFEEEIPKNSFAGLRLSSLFKLHSYGGGMDKMWNGITNVDNDLYYIATGNTTMPYFTFDMGIKAKLSRFRVWGRVNYLYALHNPKEFEWYGTNDATAAADADNLQWENNPAWTKLMTCVSHKPSGDESATVTSEDQAYAKAGEEFEFPLEAPSVRYLRFKLLRTWSGSSGVHINELTFWGQIEK